MPATKAGLFFKEQQQAKAVPEEILKASKGNGQRPKAWRLCVMDLERPVVAGSSVQLHLNAHTTNPDACVVKHTDKASEDKHGHETVAIGHDERIV